MDFAEYVALRTIVLALISDLAAKHQYSGSGPAQTFVNHLAEVCFEEIGRSEQQEIDRQLLLDKVRAILALVICPPNQNATN